MSWHQKQWLEAGAGTLGLLATLASGGALGPEAASLLGGSGVAGAVPTTIEGGLGASPELLAASGMGADAGAAKGGLDLAALLSSGAKDAGGAMATQGAMMAATPKRTLNTPQASPFQQMPQGQQMQPMAMPSYEQQMRQLGFV